MSKEKTAAHYVEQAAIKDQIVEWSEQIALKVAKNAGVAPQLCFPHIYLGLSDILLSQAAAPQVPAQADSAAERQAGYLEGLEAAANWIEYDESDTGANFAASIRALKSEVSK